MSITDPAGENAFICPMCGKPIDLDTDDTADEQGQVMHAQCYFKRVGGYGQLPPSSTPD